MGFLAILISIKVLHTVDYLIYRKSPVVSLYAEVDDIKSVSCLLSYAREHGMALGDLEITKQKQMNGGGICIRGTSRMEQRKPHDVIIQEFGQLPGVSYVEEPVSYTHLFQIFDAVNLITGGGPLNSTNTLVYYIYEQTYKFGKLGTGSAASLLLLILVGVLTFLYFKVLEKRVHYQ